MQIPSSTSYFGSTATRATSNAGAASAANSTSTTTPTTGKLKPKGDDVVREFMDYAMDPMERLRANILKSMGLTEDDLKNMSPEQQKAVEQKIEQIIQQQLQKNAGKTGQVVNISA
jgi:hypothetical protein